MIAGLAAIVPPSSTGVSVHPACFATTEVIVRNRSRSRLAHVLVFLVAVITLLAAAPSSLTVMTFNIRYGTAEDGDNHWDRRGDLLFQVIRDEEADIVGLQEALRFQIDQIVAAAPAYAFVGVGRDDGREAGEHTAILYRRERFSVLESGTFWFSDTPDQPGSTSWGNRITRICTWARFRDGTGGSFYVFNVHLDHESQPSRERSVQLLAARIRERAVPDAPVIVTGDFNIDEQNPATRWLLGVEDALPGAGKSGIDLADTFRALHPEARGAGTFTGFTFGSIDERKIDYVLIGTGFVAREARIVHTSRAGRYPSDHFPVVARVERRNPER
jgi:endonuclease/exonuclease/phosphatase family metal-dependent hydrolase